MTRFPNVITRIPLAPVGGSSPPSGGFERAFRGVTCTPVRRNHDRRSGFPPPGSSATVSGRGHRLRIPRYQVRPDVFAFNSENLKEPHSGVQSIRLTAVPVRLTATSCDVRRSPSRDSGPSRPASPVRACGRDSSEQLAVVVPHRRAPVVQAAVLLHKVRTDGFHYVRDVGCKVTRQTEKRRSGGLSAPTLQSDVTNGIGALTSADKKVGHERVTN